MCLSRYFINFRVAEQISHFPHSHIWWWIPCFISNWNDDELLVMIITVNIIHLSEIPSLDIHNSLFKISNLKNQFTIHQMQCKNIFVFYVSCFLKDVVRASEPSQAQKCCCNENFALVDIVIAKYYNFQIWKFGKNKLDKRHFGFRTVTSGSALLVLKGSF